MLTQDQLNAIKAYSNSERQFNDNCKTFDTLGHYFKFNVATTLANSYNIQGKPTLNADAIVGAVRRYKDEDGEKICGGFTVLHSDDESCTMQAIRLDEQRAAQAKADALNEPLLIALEKATEPELVKYILNMIASNNVQASQAGIHTHTFTISHAKQRGKDKDRAWRQMPKNMLQKRCATALARQAFPEIIGVTYSPDEYAEMVIKDEQERDAIVFASAAGERVPSRAPAPVPPSLPAPVPPSLPAPKPTTTSNPYPRVYQSVNMTASEALIKLKDLSEDQVLSLAKETQSYLVGCSLGSTPIEHVTNALTKLKVKEYQETVDMIHAVAAKRGDFDDELSYYIVEYIKFAVLEDVACYDFHDTLKAML